MTKKKPAKKKTTIEGEFIPSKVGRPSKFKEEFIELAYNYCLLHATDKELAGYFDVSEATLHNWKNDHPEFLESIHAGKETADAKTARSLFERANGYSHPEEKIFCTDGKVTKVQTIRHYPPDTNAASLWLRNRVPKKWRDQQHVEHSDRPLKDLTLDELIQLRIRLESQRKSLSGEK